MPVRDNASAVALRGFQGLIPQFQPNLHLSREVAVRSDNPEAGSAESRSGASPIRVICRIEKLAPKLQARPFGEGKLLNERQIQVSSSGSDEDSSAGIP